MIRALLSGSLFLVALFGCGGEPPCVDGVEVDAGTSGIDAGEHGDAGQAIDAGALDAGFSDAGAADAGAADAGEDAGVRGPAAMSADASISVEDAGYAEVDLLTRDPVMKTSALTLDGGFLVAVSRHALVVAEGPQCEYSQVNRYACDYRWVTDGGTSLVVTNATGEPHERGEVMLLRQDQRPECTTPLSVVESATARLVDVEEGLVRLTWPRTDTRLLPTLAEGDFVAARAEGSVVQCDGGWSSIVPNTFTRVRPPHARFVAARAQELGHDRLLLLDSTEVSRVEADGRRARVMLVPPQRVADAHRELDTFTLRLDDDAAQVDELFRGALDGGALASLGRFDRRVHSLGVEGGRFASVVENEDFTSRRVVDSAGLVPDLRYSGWGVVLERAPVMVGSAGGKLVVSRLDLGTTAATGIDATPSSVRHVFPGGEAALVLGPDKVAWLVERTGLAQLTTDATAVAAARGTNLRPTSPRDLLLLIRTVAGQRQLVAVDRAARRLVTLSSNVRFDASAPYVFDCGRPGRLTVDSPFLFFAEPSAQPGRLDLFLVRADLATPPRLVGTTTAFGCQAPVVSRDGARFAVNEDGHVSVGDWL